MRMTPLLRQGGPAHPGGLGVPVALSPSQLQTLGVQRREDFVARPSPLVAARRRPRSR